MAFQIKERTDADADADADVLKLMHGTILQMQRPQQFIRYQVITTMNRYRDDSL